MGIFDVLTMIGGLCLFLFGMDLMGSALERRAGSKLRDVLGRLTNNPFAGFLTGLGVTAVIQSSSATTVMVVGFVNSGLMSLRQSIGVIMGANVGTTVTAWVLSLGGISSSNPFVQLLKPSSFTPVLAAIGIVLYMFLKGDKKKDTGAILLGFATLMFGMETMSDAVKGLANVPEFTELFLLFENPFLGMLAGAVLTAVIQSSSASVGILQALAIGTGAVTFGSAIPIIMGQHIGTCITAMLSSIGAKVAAKRAAVVHLSFNVIGTAVWLTAFCIVSLFLPEGLLSTPVGTVGIPVAHSVCSILNVLLLFPMAGLLEKLACKLVPDAKTPEAVVELDERLLKTPPLALAASHRLTVTMAEVSVRSLKNAMAALTGYTPELAKAVRDDEDKSDHYEDILGSYLVKLSSNQLGDADSAEAAKLLRLIGDFERISDHSVNVLEAAEELRDKGLALSAPAEAELRVLCAAVEEILDLALSSFVNTDLEAAIMVEPLEGVIDDLKEKLRGAHILRMQQGKCS
ncbi:MAG: Na/Pi cotransporter family protein, partial [Clostridia bacterium]|nr:Na/Pi cotransporter family protein [Clostridia bacterium]